MSQKYKCVNTKETDQLRFHCGECHKRINPIENGFFVKINQYTKENNSVKVHPDILITELWKGCEDHPNSGWYYLFVDNTV